MDLNLVNAIDPRLTALTTSQDKMVYEVSQGAAYTNKIAQKANSVSNQSVSFNFNTQGKNVLIDRRFYVRMRFQVDAVIVPTALNTFDDYNRDIVPRAFPIASCAENVSVTINGTTVSANYADMMSAYLQYSSPEELFAYDLSGTPTQLDYFTSYNENSFGGRRDDGYTNHGLKRSPKSPFNDEFTNDSKQLSRGSFNFITRQGGVLVAGANARRYVFEVVEPLMLSPLLYSSQNLESALLGVTNLAVNINFGNLNRLMSQVLDTGAFNTTYTGSITGTPELLIEYKNLQLVEESKIPQIVRYNYSRPEVFVNDTNTQLAASTLTAFGTATVNNNAIQLSACPKRIYIYASIKRGDKTATDADSFIPITSLSLSYLNVSGQFSSFSQHDLYTMSVKNGYRGAFQNWSGLSNNSMHGFNTTITESGMGGRIGLAGGVLCIDSTDLALPSNIAAGILVNSQLQFTVGLLNNDLIQKNVTITTVVVQAGIMEIADGGMTTRIGVLSSEDVLRVRSSGESTALVHHTQLEGGGVFDFMRKVVGAVPQLVSKAGDVIETGKDVFNVGKKVLETGRSVLGRGLHDGGALVAGALTGGRNMSKAELRRLLG